MTQRHGSKDDGAIDNRFGNVSLSYGTYTTYGRPQVQNEFLHFYCACLLCVSEVLSWKF